MIRVVIVEDLLVVREQLRYILESDPDIQVVGMAADGQDGVELILKTKPDVVLMDINMPKLNGFEATRQLMERQAVPIVLASASWRPKEMETTFKAVEAGAVAVVEKPHGIDELQNQDTAKKLIETIKLMSEVRVITRRPRQEISVPQIRRHRETPELKPASNRHKLVVIGGSTGAPVVIQTILSHLPKAFPLPILMVQHITVGFLPGLVDWLTKTTGFPVKIAEQGEVIQPGHLYFAPDHLHMGIKGRCIELIESAPIDGVRPAVDYLFRSTARAWGPGAIGVLLTGMGRDGASALGLIREKGGFTMVQNKETSTVYGMPGEAVRLNAAMHVLSPLEIASKLENLVIR